MSEEFFHVSYFDYVPGESIKKGRWGQTVHNVPYAQFSYLSALIEYIFEEVRQKIEKEKKVQLVSRFECVFGTKTLESAKMFRDKYRQGAHIYSITPAVPSAVTIADFDLATNGHTSIRATLKNAEKYWGGEIISPYQEVLIGSDILIIKKLNDNP